ncbi:MAG: hypothetical protein KDK39_17030 [Leptospiraceae bacterium]|nr:hypothetical protein [Leptospiraceae bacterium]
MNLNLFFNRLGTIVILILMLLSAHCSNGPRRVAGQTPGTYVYTSENQGVFMVFDADRPIPDSDTNYPAVQVYIAGPERHLKVSVVDVHGQVLKVVFDDMIGGEIRIGWCGCKGNTMKNKFPPGQYFFIGVLNEEDFFRVQFRL